MLVRAFDAGDGAAARDDALVVTADDTVVAGKDDAAAVAPQQPLVVVLHGRGGDAASGIALARSFFGLAPRVVALQAARPCNPMQSNLRAASAYAGFSWYLGEDAAHPEAASFGDALRQLELFVRELDEPFVLAGKGQGAVLAFACALLAPKGLRAVVVDGAASPALDGWDPPRRALGGVRFFARDLDAASRERTGAMLEARGALLEDPPSLASGTGTAARAVGAMRDAATSIAPIAALLACSAAAALAVGLSPAPSLAASAGAQPATTGVPAVGAQAAEPTCISCHNSSPLNPDTQGSITLDGAPATYEPGKVYRLTLRIAHSDKTPLRWGFQLTAIAIKDGEGAGELIASDTARTQLLPVVSGTRAYISHGYNGTDIGTTGGTSWSFDWKAPAQPVGKVGFFACANAANADGSNQGDRIYSKSPSPIAESDAP